MAYLAVEKPLKAGSAQKILEIISSKTNALLHGEFTLASGKKSPYYYDGKMVVLYPEGAYWVGKAIFDELASVGIESVGGLEIGAIPIATAVSLVSYLEGKYIPSFIVRDKQKDHGTMKEIEGHIKDNSNVAIVDDVITGGSSIKKAIDAVEARGCHVVKIIVIVDRHEGGSDRLRNKGYNVVSIIDIWPSGDVTTNETNKSDKIFTERTLPR